MDDRVIDRVIRELADLTDRGVVAWTLRDGKLHGRLLALDAGWEGPDQYWHSFQVMLTRLVPYWLGTLDQRLITQLLAMAADNAPGHRAEIRDRLLEAARLRSRGLGRLSRLANFLEFEVSPWRFNLSYWANGPLSTDLSHSCGTAGCACGWAAAIPEFHEAGFRLNKDMLIPQFQDSYGFEAAEQFFELATDDARHLFFSERYDGTPTLDVVVARIRDFVTQKRSPTDES